MKSLITFLLFVTSLNSFSQLVTDPLYTPTELIEILKGPDILITSVSYIGADSARAYFDATNTSLGINEGIVLTSGTALDSVYTGFPFPFRGPPNTASNNAAYDNYEPGYGLLQSSSGVPSFNASVFEIEMTPGGDTLFINCVFGSEEYPEYVCFDFSDAIGFFISGPNPNGGTYVDSNFATVPGTTFPISVNSINDGNIGINGDSSYCTVAELANTAYYVDNSSGTNIIYDGLTVPIQCKIPVECGGEYILKIGIGDIGDGTLDSGLFLEKNSLTCSSPGCGLSIQQVVEKGIQIFPTIIQNEFTINAHEDFIGSSVVLYDITGKEVLKKQLIEIQSIINVEFLNKGTYFVIIESSDIRSPTSILIKE